MKPLRLVMRAFGPYPAEEIIDFRRLGRGALFLICGSTGSGKSTIIDAMAFALYGEACSEDRDGRGSRSHLATAERRTEVVFDFALGPERYRVVRSPEQERPKKRGAGSTTEMQRAELWRRTKLAEGDDVLEGESVAARWEAVNEKIVALLGFDCQQFQQVIVLPQGRFRELLTADVRAREAIFERLFRTSIYSALQDRLKERAKGIEQEHETLKTRREEVLRQSLAGNPEALASQRAENAERLAAAAAEHASLVLAASQAQETLDRARAAAAKFTERAAAASQLEAQSLAMTNVAPNREEGRLAKQALPVQPFARAAALREQERTQAGQRRDEAQAALRLAAKLAAEASARLEAEEKRAPERDAGVAMVVRLQGLSGKVGALAELSARGEKARSLAQERRCRTAESSRSLETLAADIARKAADLAQWEHEAAPADRLAARVETLGREAALHADLLRGRRGIAAGEQALAALMEARRGAESARGKAASELEALETAQRLGRAALLSQTLVREEPCPVCGSRHHPQPAQAEIAPPTDAEVAAAKETLGRAEAELRTAQEKVVQAEKELSALGSQAAGWTQALGEAAELTPEIVHARLEETQRGLARAVAARKSLVGLGCSLAELRAEYEKLRIAHPALETAERDAALAAEGLAAELAAHERDVPVDLRTPAALQTRLEYEESQRHSLALALDNARRRAAETLRDADAAEVRCGGLATILEEAEAALENACRELAAELDRAGFADAAALRAASRTAQEAAGLEAAVRLADEQHAAARERLLRADAAIAGLQPPDVPACEARQQEANAVLRQHIGATAALEQRGQALALATQSLETIDGALAAVQQDYEVFGTLAEIANGRNGRNLTLQRYVLGALLDDVLVAATRRLLVMSRGRFQLLRQRGLTDGRMAAGLALEVLDEYTGKVRPVGTLSGGESFLAALSLALGLADVVQAHAGGVRMEAMFIDEGFGSLDPEALDFAFQALLDLQRGGRLVGIISHVEELKQRIDLRLEIRAGRGGSSTRFVGVAPPQEGR